MSAGCSCDPPVRIEMPHAPWDCLQSNTVWDVDAPIPFELVEDDE